MWLFLGFASVYFFLGLLFGIVGSKTDTAERKYKDMIIIYITVVIVIIVSALSILSGAYKGQPITELEHGEIYLTCSEDYVSRNGETNHSLVLKKVGKEPLYYEIPKGLLVDETGKPFTKKHPIYPAFEVRLTNKVRVISDGLNQKAKNIMVYSCSPVAAYFPFKEH